MGKPNLSDAVSGRQRRENPDRDRATAQATGEDQHEPVRRLNANVPESVHQAFKQACKSRGLSMQFVLRRFAEHFTETGELP